MRISVVARAEVFADPNSSPTRGGTGRSVLDPPDVQHGGQKVDLILAQVHQFGTLSPCLRATRIIVASRWPREWLNADHSKSHGSA